MTKIINKNPSELINYERNNKTHNEKQIDLLANSIKEYGMNSPIIIDSNNIIIAGHGRLEACKKLGLKEVPIVVKDDLTDKQIKRYRLLDNKIAELAEDNIENIKFELDELEDMELNELYDLDIDFLDSEKDEDDVPEEPEKILVKSGDIFQLGNHKIILGDATNSEDVKNLLGDELLDCIWTDPPYNVNYEGNNGMKIKNDSMGDEKFYNFLYDSYVNMFIGLKEGAPIYVAHADTEGLNFRKAFKDAGFKLSGCIIWNKPNFVMGRSDYQWKHEPILYGWKEGKAHKWYGKRNKSTVLTEGVDYIQETDDGVEVLINSQWVKISGKDLIIEGGDTSVVNVDKPKKSNLHPTMKPIALVERMLKNSTQVGDLVGDYFSGSGSTLITCEKMQRKARVIEFDPVYFQRTIKRYYNYTSGKKEIKCLNRELDLNLILKK